MLAKEGMKVCVLEKNKQIGGCLQSFAHQKTVFDSCVHYVGGLGAGHTLHQILSYAGVMQQLQLKSLDSSGFDRILFGDEETQFPVAMGFENFTEQLAPPFPEERKALQNYTALLKNTGDHFPLYRLRNGEASEKNAVASLALDAVLKSITKNNLLQNILTGNNLLYAGELHKTPFYLHALVTESYLHSAHKIIPASSSIAKLLAQQLRHYGGQIERNTEVVKLVEANGKITHAITESGQTFYGKHFIANVHPQLLVKMLNSSLIKPAFRNRINSLEQTISSFMLNLVLKPNTISHQHFNSYWHRTKNVWKAVHYQPENWPENYALYFNESRSHPGFAESVSILTYMRFDEVKQWETTLNHSAKKSGREGAYHDFKEAHAEKLLQQVSKQIPELKGNILAKSIATPLTFRDYTGTPEGALYGNLKNVNKPAETTISTRTKIPNLFLTGQNVNMHGVLGVSITAVATCGELLGLDYLLKKIKGS